MKKKRVFLLLFFTTTGIVLAFVFSFLLLFQVIDRLAGKLRDHILVGIGSELGYTIRYSHISPAILSFLEIENLRIVDREAPEREVARIDRVLLFVNPFRLLLKRQALKEIGLLSLISSIVVTEAQVTLDQKKDKALLTARDAGSPKTKRDVPSTFSFSDAFLGTSLEIRNLNLTYSMNGRAMTLERAKLRFQNVGKLHEVNLRAHVEVSQLFSPESNGNKHIFADVVVDGQGFRGFRDLNLTIQVANLETSHMALKKLTVFVGKQGQKIEIRKVQDLLPLDLQLSYDLEKRSLEGEYKAQNLDLKRLLRLDANLDNLSPLLEGHLTGGGKIRREKGGKLDYRAHARLTWPASPSRLDFFIDGNEKTLYARKLDLWRNENSGFSFRGEFSGENFLPSGVLTFKKLLVRKKLLDGDFIFTKVDRGIQIVPRTLSWGSLSFEDLKAVVLVNEPSEYSFSLMMNFPRQEKNQPGQLLIDATLPGVVAPLSVTFSGQQIPVEYLNFFSSVNVAWIFSVLLSPEEKEYVTNFEGVLHYRRKGVSLSLPSLAVQPENLAGPEGIFVSLEMSPRGIDLRKFQWITTAHHVHLSLRKKETQEGQSLFRGLIGIDDFSHPFSGTSSKDGKIALVGKHSKGALFFSKEGLSNGFLNIEQFPIHLGQGTTFFSLESAFSREFDRWKWSVKQLRLKKVGRENKDNIDVLARGELTSAGVILSDFSYRNAQTSLKGSGAFVRSAEGLNGHLTMEGLQGESIKVKFFQHERKIDARYAVTALPLQFFSPYFPFLNKSPVTRKIISASPTGLIFADGSFIGTFKNPLARLSLEIREGLYGGKAFDFLLETSIERKRLRVSQLRLNMERGVQITRGLLFGDMQKGSLVGTLAFRYDDEAETDFGGSLAFDVHFPANLTLTDLTKKELPLSGHIQTSPISWQQKDIFPGLTTRWRLDQRRIEVSIDDDVAYFSMDRRGGGFDLKIQKEFPLQIQANGRFKDGFLLTHVEKFTLDPRTINYFVPQDPIPNLPYIILTGGKLKGSLLIWGPLDGLLSTGFLIAEEMSAEMPYSKEVIGPVSFSLSVNDGVSLFQDIILPVGEGKLLTSGEIKWEGPIPSEVSFDLDSSVFGGVLMSYSAYRFAGEINVKGKAHFDITRDGILISGKALLSDGSFHLDEPNILEEPNSASLYDVAVDMDVTIGSNLTLFIPSRRFPLVRALLEPEGEVTVFYRSRGRVLSFLGSVTAQGGEIRYLDRAFRLVEGKVDLRETIERFNPLVNLKGEMNALDSENQRVLVRMIYDGYVLSGIVPRFEAEPARSNEEILALLGQRTGDIAPLLVTEVGGLISRRTGFVETLETALRKFLSVDTVALRTEIIENLLLVNPVSALSLYPTSGALRYLDNTRLSLSSTVLDYAGGGVSFQGSLALDYDNDSENLLYKPEAGLNFDMPYFSVRWRTLMIDPEQLFVPGTNVSFVLRPLQLIKEKSSPLEE